MRLSLMTGKGRFTPEQREAIRDGHIGEYFSQALVRCDCGNEWDHKVFHRFEDDVACPLCGSTFVSVRGVVFHGMVSEGVLIVVMERRIEHGDACRR